MYGMAARELGSEILHSWWSLPNLDLVADQEIYQQPLSEGMLDARIW